MWIYEKKLEHPVRVTCPDVKFAKMVITQYGGPDGELGASLRYLNQRYSMPTDKAKGICTYRYRKISPQTQSEYARQQRHSRA